MYSYYSFIIQCRISLLNWLFIFLWDVCIVSLFPLYKGRGELHYYLNRLQVNSLLHFYKPPIHLKEEPFCICNSSLFVVKAQVFAYLIISIRCKGTAFIFSFNLYLLQRRCSFYLQFISIRSRGATQHISIKG